jgi:hypothetical protein
MLQIKHFKKLNINVKKKLFYQHNNKKKEQEKNMIKRTSSEIPNEKERERERGRCGTCR